MIKPKTLADEEIMVARVNPNKYLKASEEFGHPLASVEERAIAQKATNEAYRKTVEQIVEWHLQPCPHRANNAKYFKPVCACEKCWQTLERGIQ